MHCVICRALTAPFVLLSLLLLALSAQAQNGGTTTTTLTFTAILGTSTTTITTGTTVVESATTVVSQTLITTATSGPPAPSGEGTMSWSGESFQSAVLNSTNVYRERYLAQPLAWNSTLANFAASHAHQCIWEHSGGPNGENLAENFETSTLAIDAWASEESHYDYAKASFGEKTGHFTQLVWQETATFGCGAVNCSNGTSNGANGWYLVCEYWPPGNVGGAFKSNVLKAGESRDGKLGLGEGASVRAGTKWLVVLVAVGSVLGATWL